MFTHVLSIQNILMVCIIRILKIVNCFSNNYIPIENVDNKRGSMEKRISEAFGIMGHGNILKIPWIARRIKFVLKVLLKIDIHQRLLKVYIEYTDVVLMAYNLCEYNCQHNSL